MSDKELKNADSVSEKTTVEVTEEKENVAAETVKEEAKTENSNDIVGKGKDAIKEATEKATEGAKSILNKLPKNVKIIVLGVVALILIILLGSCVAGSGSRYTKAEIEKTYLINSEDEVLVALNGTEVKVDDDFSGVEYSADKSLAVVTDSDDTLYVIKGKELVEVAEDVYYFVISNKGDTIAYVTDVEDYKGTLYLYSVSKKSSTEITDEVYPRSIVLSPNGKTVAYIEDIDVDNYYSVCGDLYVSKNGKEGKKLYSDAMPLAVTDNGKNVFYLKDGKKLYMNEEKLSSDVSYSFFFTEDYKEVVFNEDGKAYYYTVKMKEPVKVKGESFGGLYIPANTMGSYRSIGDYSVTMYGVESFNETLWKLGGSAYYVFKKGKEADKVSSYMSQYQMSENGKSILFLDSDDDLCYIKNIEKSRKIEKKAEDIDISRFVASSDLKKIYFYDYDEGELCFLKKGKGVLITDDTTDFVYSDKYKVLYFIEDEELFYATTSAKSKKRVVGEVVEELYNFGDYILFDYENDDDEESCNVMTKKNKYKALIAED